MGRCAGAGLGACRGRLEQHGPLDSGVVASQWFSPADKGAGRAGMVCGARLQLRLRAGERGVVDEARC